MNLTPKMWTLQKRIDWLQWVCISDPGDYLSLCELEELRIEFDKLDKRNKLGLKLIPGGKQLSKSSTESAA